MSNHALLITALQLSYPTKRINQYFDGRKADDEILYRANITRKQLREVLHAYDEYVCSSFGIMSTLTVANAHLSSLKHFYIRKIGWTREELLSFFMYPAQQPFCLGTIETARPRPFLRGNVFVAPSPKGLEVFV